MSARLIWFAPLFAAALLLAACSSTAAGDYLTEDIPPCTPVAGVSVDPCATGVALTLSAQGGLGSSGFLFQDAPRSIREQLDGEALIAIPHIVVRGTFLPDTVRCESGVPNRELPYMQPGGWFEYSILLQCYADVRVNSYILGDGPSQLTVLASFHHYWDGSFAESAAQRGITEAAYTEDMRRLFEDLLEKGPIPIEGEGARGPSIYGREVILFLGPAHNHATEAWEQYTVWDVQRKDDGTVIAVHPNRDRWRVWSLDDYQTHRAALEMELPAFTAAVTAAHNARMTEHGGRIGPEDIQGKREGVDLPMLVTDANQLTQFYMATGAYDHPDGPPAQPPPTP